MGSCGTKQNSHLNSLFVTSFWKIKSPKATRINNKRIETERQSGILNKFVPINTTFMSLDCHLPRRFCLAKYYFFDHSFSFCGQVIKILSWKKRIIQSERFYQVDRNNTSHIKKIYKFSCWLCQLPRSFAMPSALWTVALFRER